MTIVAAGNRTVTCRKSRITAVTPAVATVQGSTIKAPPGDIPGEPSEVTAVNRETNINSITWHCFSGITGVACIASHIATGCMRYVGTGTVLRGTGFCILGTGIAYQTVGS